MDRVNRIKEVDSLINSGNYDDAMLILEELEEEVREDGGGPQLFSILWRKGWILYRKMNLEESLKNLMEADGSLPYGEMSPTLLRTRLFVLSTIGTVLHGLKEFKRAEEYHTRAIGILDVLRDYLPPETYLLEMARILNNRANAFVGMGEFERAIGDYVEAMSMLNTMENSDPPVLHLVADINYNLGSLYYYLNDVSKACNMWREAFKVYSNLCNAFGKEIYCTNARKILKSLERNCS
jgi:tetratricopeptide (TPR) repeat protein